jgi:hypothetical protein
MAALMSTAVRTSNPNQKKLGVRKTTFFLKNDFFKFMDHVASYLGETDAVFLERCYKIVYHIVLTTAKT